VTAFNKCNQFVEDLAKGVHNLSSGQLTVALTAAANAPTSATAVLGDLTQISYTNCSARTVTTTSAEQTSGTLKLICVDLVLTASGAVGPFRYVVLYNDTPVGDPVIGYYDYGSEITLANGETFTIDFSAGDGVLTIA
jgi:hypothetical protein